MCSISVSLLIIVKLLRSASRELALQLVMTLCEDVKLDRFTQVTLNKSYFQQRLNCMNVTSGIDISFFKLDKPTYVPVAFLYYIPHLQDFLFDYILFLDWI